MTLTPEQFNKIALKEDVSRVEDKLDKLIDTVDSLVNSMDSQKKKLDNIEHAFVSNQAAHDRFEKRLTRLEKHLELNPLFDY